jgi:hypothetical protein
MAIKYVNIFKSKALQNLPEFEFLFENKPSGNPLLHRFTDIDVYFHSLIFKNVCFQIGKQIMVSVCSLFIPVNL